MSTTNTTTNDTISTPPPTTPQTPLSPPTQPTNNSTTPTTPTQNTTTVIIPADQVNNTDASKTVEFFVTYASTQTVIDGKTTNILKTQTFASIRPITKASDATVMMPNMLLILLILFFK